MKSVFKEKRTGTYQSRIFLLLLAVSVLPVLIAGIISYRIYMEEVTKQTDLSMEAMEMQVYNDVEAVLSGMRQYYSEITTREEITWLANTDSIPYSEYTNLFDAQKVLKGPTYLSETVGNYAFMNLKKGWILTNNGMYTLDEVRNREQMDSFLEHAAENPSTLYWYNNTKEQSPYVKGLYQSGTLDFSGFHLVMKLPGIANRMDQVLLVQLNLNNMVNRLETGLAGYDVCILDRDGKFLFASDEMFAQYCSTNLEELLKKDKTKGPAITGGNQNEYRMRIHDVTSNGMIYVTAYNMNDVKEGAGRILAVSLKLMAALLVLLAVCTYATKILYKPVKNLTSYLSETVGEKDKKTDEFAYIRENVGQLIDSREDLWQMVQKQQNILVEQFLLRVLRGELTSDAIHTAQEQLQLKKARHYCLLAGVCMLDSETSQDSELESEALSMVIVQKIPAAISDLLVATPFAYNEDFLFVIGADEEEELRTLTISLHEKLAEFIQMEFGCPIITGVSQNFVRLKYLRTAYNECTETLRNTRNDKKDQGDITFYEEIAQNEGGINGYDFVIENALTKAINDGNSQDAAFMVDRFVNSLNNRGITYHDRSYYLHRMSVAVLSVLSDAGLSANKVFAEHSEDIFTTLNQLNESDKLKSYINRHIVQPVVDALKQYRYNASSDILRRVMELVSETKGDITLTECAERLSYHPSYIWKVLKAERNMTFTDLVNYEKLETAKKMLLETNLSVADIAEQLSYSNTQNFIRFFSKYVQMTPGKYRKENQHLENLS